MKVKSKQEPEGDVFLDLCHLRDKTPVCHCVPVIKSLTVVNLDPKFQFVEITAFSQRNVLVEGCKENKGYYGQHVNVLASVTWVIEAAIAHDLAKLQTDDMKKDYKKKN